MRVQGAQRRGEWLAVVVCLLSLSCSPTRLEPDDGRLQVVVSVLPQAYFVERLGGELVEVIALIPPGASPTNFEPSFAQVKALDEAALYVKVGHPHFPFETSWLDRLLAEKSELLILSMMAGQADASSGSAHSEDPHVWLSLRRVKALSLQIHEALLGLLPENREQLDLNLESFLKEIHELEEELGVLFAGHAGKRFVVFHPAWATFAAEHGLVQLAVEEHGKEANAHSLARLLATTREAGIDVLFTEPQGELSAAQFVAGEMGARIETIDPLARDWTTNLRRVAHSIAGALR